MAEAQVTGPTGSPRLFYGWVIVGATFLAQFVSTGWVFYSLPMMLTPLADEFAEGNRTPIATLMPITSLAGMVMAPVMGRLVGRGYARAIMVLSAIALGTSLLLVAYANALWQIQVLFATLVGFGMGGLATLTCAPLIANWFDARRAWALGISQLGASSGGAVMAPVIALLLESLGWRGAFVVLGVSALLVAPVLAALVVQHPEQRGLQADGRAPQDSEQLAPVERSPTIPSTGEVLRDANLWLIASATGLGFLATASVVQHIAAFGTDAGFTRARAAVLASIISAGAAGGKLVFGRLCDEIGEVNAFITSLLGYALGLGLLTQLEGYAVVVGCCALVGLSMGGLLPVSTALMARAFGREQMGPKMGIALPIMSGVQLPGPLAMALVFDVSGSYDGGFFALAALLVLAAFLVRQIRLPRTG